MKRKIINKNGRDKAFLGSIIGAVGSTIGGIVSARKQKKAAEQQYRQQQEAQTQSEGVQQAAAMSAQYANQDYVDDYRKKIALKGGGKVSMKGKGNDRLAMAKKCRCGGRKKASLGKILYDDVKSIGSEFDKDNLAGTMTGMATGVLKGVDTAFSSSGPQRPVSNTLQSTATTSGYISAANEAARQAEIRKQQRTTAARYGGKKKIAYGGRRKASFGIGEAVGGISNLVGSFFQSGNPGKMVKRADGFAYDTPKTGLQQADYKTDGNGNPVNAVNVVNADGDRLTRERMYRCGGKKMGKKRK